MYTKEATKTNGSFCDQLNNIGDQSCQSQNHACGKGPPEAILANLQLELVAQGHIQLSFKYPQEWKFCNLSVQAVPIFNHFHGKKKKIQKSVVKQEFSMFKPFFSVSSTVHLQVESGFFSTVLVRYLEIAIRSTLTLLFPRLNHVCQPLFIHVFHYLCGDSLLDFLSYINHFLAMGRPGQNILGKDVLHM